MPWAKLDDRLHAHPKAAKAGLEALGLHLLAMSHCAAYETDGHVHVSFPTEKAAGKGPRLAQTLVDSGLWETNGSGWVIHHWLDYNPSKAQAAAEAAAKREAGKAGGKASSKRRAGA